MANKAINNLTNASGLDPTDLLLLWDSGTNTAQNMTGQQFATWLTALAAGKGGISSITKTGTAGLVDTYTITYAGDPDHPDTFEVTNGAQGPQGDQTYVHIVYSQTEPDSDDDIGSIPAPWMGIACDTNPTAPEHYTDYTWYRIRGDKGDGVAYTALTSTSGLTRTYTMYTADGTVVGSFTVTDGSGAVSTVDGIAPDGNGDVPKTVSTVSDLELSGTPLVVGSATIADAYSALLSKQILLCPATDFDTTNLPLYGGNRQTDGDIEIMKANPGWIEFHGNKGTVGDFRMYFDVNGDPTGTWYRSDLVPESGTPTATDGTIASSAYIKRSGNVVVLDFAATGVDIPTSNTKIGSVPSKFAPSETTFGIGLIGFGAATPCCYFEVTSTGDIRIRGNTAQSSVALRAHLVWII